MTIHRLIKLLTAPALIAATLLPGAASSAEYMYRDLMGNTLPSAKCSARDDAVAKAADAYTVAKYAKTFCETQGYGWHVSEKKGDGKVVCEPCGNADKVQCHVEDVVVTCKRLKPGSVGLFPGEG